MQGQSARRCPGLRVGSQLLSNQETMNQGPGRWVGAQRVQVPTWAGVCGAANVLRGRGGDGLAGPELQGHWRATFCPCSLGWASLLPAALHLWPGETSSFLTQGPCWLVCWEPLGSVPVSVREKDSEEFCSGLQSWVETELRPEKCQHPALDGGSLRRGRQCFPVPLWAHSSS